MKHDHPTTAGRTLRALCLALPLCLPFTAHAGDVASLRVAFPSTVDIDDVGLLLAFEALEADGIDVESTFFAQGELAAVAVAGGQANIGVGSSTVWLTAIQKGAPIAGVMAQHANGWSLMATSAIDSCAAMQGERAAIHSEGSVSTAMMRAYIGSECAGTEPDYLVIPGSENRTAALLAGEIDITPVELIDSIRIASLRPDDYRRIADFAVDVPALKTSGIWASEELVTGHPETVVALLGHVLRVYRRIADDPDWFVAQVPRFMDLDEDSRALLPEIVDALLAIENFPPDGGLSLEDGQYTIDFFVDAGRLPPGLQAADVYDLSFLSDALQGLPLP